MPPQTLHSDSEQVNIADWYTDQLLLEDCGGASYNPRADLNADNIVNITDFGLLSSNMGSSAPTSWS